MTCPSSKLATPSRSPRTWRSLGSSISKSETSARRSSWVGTRCPPPFAGFAAPSAAHEQRDDGGRFVGGHLGKPRGQDYVSRLRRRVDGARAAVEPWVAPAVERVMAAAEHPLDVARADVEVADLSGVEPFDTENVTDFVEAEAGR